MHATFDVKRTKFYIEEYKKINWLHFVWQQVRDNIYHTVCGQAARNEISLWQQWTERNKAASSCKQALLAERLLCWPAKLVVVAKAAFEKVLMPFFAGRRQQQEQQQQQSTTNNKCWKFKCALYQASCWVRSFGEKW